MKNPSNLVHMTLPKSQHRYGFNNINMNRRLCVPDSFQARLELNTPQPCLTVSRHALNYILLDHVLLCCPISSLFYYTPYYIFFYILLSTFRKITSWTWNLRPARCGITIHRRIKEHTLSALLNVYSRIQPIIITDQMIQHPTFVYSVKDHYCPVYNSDEAE